MRVIWKYELQQIAMQSIEMPLGAHILSMQVQNGVPCIWCIVDTNKKVHPRDIRIVGTGMYLHDDFRGVFIGTFQIPEENLVFHVFDYGYE